MNRLSSRFSSLLVLISLPAVASNYFVGGGMGYVLDRDQKRDYGHLNFNAGIGLTESINLTLSFSGLYSGDPFSNPTFSDDLFSKSQWHRQQIELGARYHFELDEQSSFYVGVGGSKNQVSLSSGLRFEVTPHTFWLLGYQWHVDHDFSSNDTLTLLTGLEYRFGNRASRSQDEILPSSTISTVLDTSEHITVEADNALNEPQQVSSFSTTSFLCEPVMIDSVMTNNEQVKAYSVVKNDQLLKISRHFEVSLDELLHHNPQFITRKDRIYPDEVIYIPILQHTEGVSSKESFGTYLSYSVVKNDQLLKISRYFEMSLDELLHHNPQFITRKDRIYPDEVIYVPCSKNREIVEGLNTGRSNIEESK